MPLDELQRIEIAIELDKGVSHQELARKFSISESELKNIANLILEKDVSKQKVHRKRKSCLLYTSPSPRDKRQSRMPSSA